MGKTTTLTRARLVDIIGVLAVVVGLVAGMLPGLGLAPAFAGPGDPLVPPGGWEGSTTLDPTIYLDGNIVGDGSNPGGTDYDFGPFGSELPKDQVNPDDETVFLGSQREEDYPNWSIGARTIQGKSDLDRLFLDYQIDNPNNSFIWIGASRVSDNGNQQTTVEFNQSNIPTVEGFSAPYRTPGDFRIRFNFPGNGQAINLNVDVDVWTTNVVPGEYGELGSWEPADGVYGTRIGQGVLPEADGTRQFVEVEVNVRDLFFTEDGEPKTTCASFGTGSFRTEPSAGDEGGSNPLLKDFAGPYPIDLSTCAPVDVLKVDDNGDPVEGAEFTLYTDEARTNPVPEGDGITANPCTTDATGACAFGEIEPGTYYIDEVAPAGYTRDPILDVLADYPDGYRFTVAENVGRTLEFTDPLINYVIDVVCDTDDAGAELDTCYNAVGNEHDFTVTLTADGEPLAGTIDLTWTGAGDIIAIDGVDITPTDSTTCDTGADGECTVTVNSDAVGDGTLSGSFDTPFGVNAVAAAGTDNTDDAAYESISDSSDKVWIGLTAAIRADGTNVVGDEHPFTVTITQVGGPEDGAPVDGAVVDLDWDGPDGPESFSCTTGADAGDEPGECTVTVNYFGSVGDVGTMYVDEFTGTVFGGESLTVDYTTGVEAEVSDAPEATKTWIAYRGWIETTATNLVGVAHTFDVYVQQNSGDGWGAVPAGTAVEVTGGDGFVTTDTCADPGTTTDGDTGTCQVTVDSDAVDTVTLTVESIEAIDAVDSYDEDGAPMASNLLVQGNPDGYADSASKTWIEYVAAVSDDATNLVGNDHDFTITAWVVTPGDDGVDYTTVGAGHTITYEVEGVEGTCETGDAGTCTVTVDSDVPGSETVVVTAITTEGDAEQASATVADGTLSGAPAELQGEDADDTPLEGTKSWIQYLASISPDADNLVGNDHDFTITVSVDDGEGEPEGVGAGHLVTVSVDGGTDTCLTGDDSTCVITVSSDDPGSETVTILSVSTAGDAEQGTATVADGELVGDTEASADETPLAGTKTWLRYVASIDADSLNITGDDHVFTITVAVDDGEGDPEPVGAGHTVTVEVDGVEIDGTETDTCVTDEASQCTITVSSDTSGQQTVTIVSVTTEGDTEQPLATVADGSLVGDTDTSPDDTPLEATKTWASYSIDIDPPTATNLLPVDPTHDYTVTLSSDDAVNAPVGGQEIDVTISGDVGTIVDVELGDADDIAEDGLSATCTTMEDGTCVVTVSSDTPGTATIGASYEATVGESDPFTVGPVTATKIWTTFRVTVTPEQDVNLVGNEHEFVVTVEQSTEDGVWVPVVGVNPDIEVSAGDFTVDDSDCTEGDGTDAAGQCSVFVNSETVQAVTVTAQYEASIQDSGTAVFTDSGDKDWIDYAIDVTPDVDENLVDTDHVFTVTITTTFPTSEGTETMPVVGAVPTIELDGMGSITDNGCAEGTDDAGQCEVTISSSAPGDSTLTATFVGSNDVEGRDAEGEIETREYTDSGDKLWVDYLLTIDDDAVNAVGDPHTFTATLQVDTGDGFGPAAGESVAVELGGDTGELVSETCTTGTDEAGQCTIVINSDTPGTTEVGVSYLAEVGATSGTYSDDAVKFWTDIDLVKVAVVGDGEDDGDLVANPDNPTVPALVLDEATPDAPQEAVYEYTITNTGPVTLVNIVLVDDRLGTVLDGSEGITLAPGESTAVRSAETFTFTEVYGDVEDPESLVIENIGVVTANPEQDPEIEVTDTDPAVIIIQPEVLPVNPDISLVKTQVIDGLDVNPDPSNPTLGLVSWADEEVDNQEERAIPYTFPITNEGNVPLVNLTLVDDMIGEIELPADLVLQPGESIEVSAFDIVTPGDVFEADDLGAEDGTTLTGIRPNVAEVTSELEDGSQGPSASDNALVNLQAVLPVTGISGAGTLFPLSLMLTLLGAVVLFLNRRWEGHTA